MKNNFQWLQINHRLVNLLYFKNLNASQSLTVHNCRQNNHIIIFEWFIITLIERPTQKDRIKKTHNVESNIMTAAITCSIHCYHPVLIITEIISSNLHGMSLNFPNLLTYILEIQMRSLQFNEIILLCYSALTFCIQWKILFKYFIKNASKERASIQFFQFIKLNSYIKIHRSNITLILTMLFVRIFVNLLVT